MKILTVIPICKEDAARAELLLDLIYQLEGRKTEGYCVLAFAPEVHAEMRDKLIITAKLAFESVDVHQIQKLITAGPDKGAAVYAMFSECARFVSQGYRSHWLWLEPDCMPLKPGWRDTLSAAYEVQPRRYLSRWLKANEQTFIARVGVYPVNIMNDLEIANLSQVPFPNSVVSKSTRCELFQEARVVSAEDANKIRDNAVLLHGDKEGVLADWVRAKIQPSYQGGQTVAEGKADGLTFELLNRATRELGGGSVFVPDGEGNHVYAGEAPDLVTPPVMPKRRGRPAKIKSEPAPV